MATAAKTGKVGFTHSLARTQRGGALETATVTGIVSAVADVETGDVVPVGIEVPSGTVTTIRAWIGTNRARAAAAVDHPLKGVRNAAAAVLS